MFLKTRFVFPTPSDVATTTIDFCDVVPTTNDKGGVDEVSKFTISCH